ncbi:MAG: type II toxin-antitoxin system VapC family toxin [Gammaproteobacteria bacterium]
MSVYLDTHVVVWLAAGLSRKLSRRASEALESSDALLISPLVTLELAYLQEIGRIVHPPATLLAHLGQSIGLRSSEPDLARLVGIAQDLEWTRDVFDRLIVSECIWTGAPLMTRDRLIRKNFGETVW